MARGSGDKPRKQRFTKSGHTSHRPNADTPQQREPHYEPRSERPRYDDTTPYTRPSRPTTPPPPPPRRSTAPTPPRDYAPGHPQARPPAGPYDEYDPYGSPMPYERTATGPDAATPAMALGRAAVVRTHHAARIVTRKVISASKKDGADESGLTALIWNQVLSYGTDAMITVALAGTVFFGASAHAQRGNVLLYLLVTMAPFAVLAPFIGPALDRLQHGRRWTMAGTAIGRAILAIIMAGHSNELLILYPCALGSLVLSKAYAVVRAAAAPRLVPHGMTLTQANARLTIFGLASTLVLGGLVGVVIKLTGSYSTGLWLTALGFAVCAYFAFRLPPQIDSTAPARRHPEERARARTQQRVPPITRIREWAKRGFDAYLVIALQGESALRLLSGLLTIYLAFYVEGTAHGFTAAWQLGAVVGAAGVGNFAGTAIGTRVRMARPEAMIVASVAITSVFCVIVAITFSIEFAFFGMLVSAIANALSKIALDALIQRDVVETLRSSAFARSETFLQLAWVVGAAIGVVLPSDTHHGGAIGFWVAVAIVGVTAIVVTLRMRALGHGHDRAGMSAATTVTAQVPPPPPPARDGTVEVRKTRPY
jgi:MFS family permease